jgi:hypothetical protein
LTKRIEKADNFANNLKDILTGLINQGFTQRQIVETLNNSGQKTACGKEWRLLGLQRTLKRLDINTQRSAINE